jgi:hypothetical protein
MLEWMSEPPAHDSVSLYAYLASEIEENNKI